MDVQYTQAERPLLCLPKYMDFFGILSASFLAGPGSSSSTAAVEVLDPAAENSTSPKQDEEASPLKQEAPEKQDLSLPGFVEGPDNNNTSPSASSAEKTVSLPIEKGDQPATATFLKMWLRWLALNTYKGGSKIPNSASISFRPFKIWVREHDYPTISYSDVMHNDRGVKKWLQLIYDWGFCFVKDTPVNPEATEALLKRIAHIRHTHYGKFECSDDRHTLKLTVLGGFWDFTADLSFGDTAYTNEALGAHTDNTYFTDPARLQLFHLLSHTDGDGGATLLVDGFRAAKRLYYEDREHGRILKNTQHPFHASGNKDSVIQPVEQHPVFKVQPQFAGRLYQVRWNNYDRAAKWNWSHQDQEAWYRAANHFNEIIHQRDMEIRLQLEPGTALIFDNWRMLHGRSAFTGKRRMCGGYTVILGLKHGLIRYLCSLE
ncbi:putative trimethyllysine dioxygenase TmlH [Aspergillus mulundensis]|uniref:TauD/TfdA-like domain-containing protein n=1 Tax=Aspergillus mulundensis TaxID=1810919 RepID=A0A3D8T430_9EURO|nr:hypothetical protein DSM5745_00601 [Aspergillus mulundensis]RDW93279.1 hypothetical protein DSM5745_00601 [Aspergillus mulundensis]